MTILSNAKKRALVALVAAALTTAGGAEIASAKTPAGFYGLQGLGIPTQSEFHRMARGGVRFYRIGINWQLIQPSPDSSFNWAPLDPLFERTSRAGITTLPAFFRSPTWINRATNIPPIESEAQKAHYRRFLTALARRYGPGGVFWDTHPLLPYRPVKYWQAWNEVNLNFFWYSKPRVRRYVKFARLTRSTLRTVDPTAKLVTAGLITTTAPGDGIPMKAYLKRIYRVKRAKNAFDVVAIHPYARRARTVLRTVRAAREVMADNRDRKTKIWVTEVGWATGGGGSSYFRVSKAAQARRLRKALRGIRKRRKRFGVAKVFWHTWRDQAGGQNLWPQYMGLFGTNGVAKPSWYAFTRLTGGRP